MKQAPKIFLYIGLTLISFITLAMFVVINFNFRNSKNALEKLPPNLISNQSDIGQNLLTESNFKGDYSKLQSNFVTQSKGAFCGIASSVVVLNSLLSLQNPVTQNNIFNRETRKVVNPLKVTFVGTTLAQLDAILQAHKLKTRLVYAADIDLKQFRSLAKESLNNPNNFILVNYQRQAIGQNGGGHISPIGGYHQESDRFLIMDVASYKYPPVWVQTEELWRGMSIVDRTSKLSRGFIFVSSQKTVI